MRQSRKPQPRRRGRRSGFTLIELLVVVVIIGILASVAMPSFINAQDKARNASLVANVKVVQTAVETFASDNNGKPPMPAGTPGATNYAGIGKTGGLWNDGTNNPNYLPGGRLPKSPWSPIECVQETGSCYPRDNNASWMDPNPAANVWDCLKTASDSGTTCNLVTAITTPISAVNSNGVVIQSGLIVSPKNFGYIDYYANTSSNEYRIWASGKKNKFVLPVGCTEGGRIIND